MPDQTKDRIIDAAYRALVRQGYHETSMKDIAAEAGVAPGLAHYYFETKEEAVDYCEREAIPYQVIEPKEPERRPAAYADNFAFRRVEPWTH